MTKATGKGASLETRPCKPFSFNTLQREEKFQEPSKTASEFPTLQALIQPHLQSFNSIFDDGILEAAVKNLEPRVIRDENGNRLSFWLEEAQLSKPMLPEKEHYSLDRFIYPTEASCALAYVVTNRLGHGDVVLFSLFLLLSLFFAFAFLSCF